jgi:hypothetical protein
MPDTGKYYSEDTLFSANPSPENPSEGEYGDGRRRSVNSRQ